MTSTSDETETAIDSHSHTLMANHVGNRSKEPVPAKTCSSNSTTCGSQVVLDLLPPLAFSPRRTRASIPAEMTCRKLALQQQASVSANGPCNIESMPTSPFVPSSDTREDDTLYHSQPPPTWSEDTEPSTITETSSNSSRKAACAPPTQRDESTSLTITEDQVSISEISIDYYDVDGNVEEEIVFCHHGTSIDRGDVEAPRLDSHHNKEKEEEKKSPLPDWSLRLNLAPELLRSSNSRRAQPSITKRRSSISGCGSTTEFSEPAVTSWRNSNSGNGGGCGTVMSEESSSSACTATTSTSMKRAPSKRKKHINKPPRNLRTTGSLVTLYMSNWHLTALNAKNNVWVEYLIYTAIAIAMQLLLGWGYVFRDGRNPTCHFVDGYSTKNPLMCDLEKTLEQGNYTIRVLVAFILGGFIANTVYLWRLRRTAYCMLCGATRNLIIQIATLLPSNADDDTNNSHRSDEIMMARQTMERWAILGYELSVLKARGQCDTLDGRTYLESKGLLVGDEWDSMIEGDRHTTVWFWIQQKSVQLAERNIIPSEFRLQTICNAVTLIRDKANDLMSCIDRDQPVAYTSVVGLLINLSLLLTALWKGVLWSIWFYDTHGLVWATPKMYLDVLVTVGFNAVFAMLFDISQVLYNPFGNRDGVDIPHDVVSGGLRNLAKRLGKMERCEPSSMFYSRRSAGMTRRGSMASITDLARNIEFETRQVFGSHNNHGGFPRLFGGGGDKTKSAGPCLSVGLDVSDEV